jgi:hypothetical protein
VYTLLEKNSIKKSGRFNLKFSFNKTFLTIIFVAVSIIINSQKTFSQIKYHLQVEIVDDKKFELNYKKEFPDSIGVATEIKKIMDNVWSKGYVNSYCETSIVDSSNFRANLFLGQKYDSFLIRKITKTNKAEIDGLAEVRMKNYTMKELAELKEKIIETCERQAYPFAAVSLDSMIYEKNTVAANLLIAPNQKIKIDSIVFYGNSNINKKYLFKYIGIRPLDDYDERSIKSINNRLNELPFLNQSKPYKVIFTKKYTKLVLNLDKKKANKFDGFLGFLPNEKDGGVNITGQLNFKLQNIISHGETIELEWRKLQPLTQDLKTNFVYPYIFNLPFGIEHNLKLYKRDTTFIDVSNSFGIQYLLIGGNNLKFFINRRNINLINTAGYENATILPEFADVANTSYGIAININNTDYKLNPRKGLRTNIQGTAGTKQIKKNQIFNESVYDNISLLSQQFQIVGATSYFFPIFKKSTILVDIKYATIIGKNIFTNELYRIGGLVSLRGFDEESINASTYVMPAIEYRFLFDKNSAIFLFANGAYYENISRTKRVFDRPYGFGTGIFFDTKAGIFSLTYAIGKQFDNPIILRNAKIHFGLVSVF